MAFVGGGSPGFLEHHCLTLSRKWRWCPARSISEDKGRPFGDLDWKAYLLGCPDWPTRASLDLEGGKGGSSVRPTVRVYSGAEVDGWSEILLTLDVDGYTNHVHLRQANLLESTFWRTILWKVLVNTGDVLSVLDTIPLLVDDRDLQPPSMVGQGRVLALKAWTSAGDFANMSPWAAPRYPVPHREC